MILAALKTTRHDIFIVDVEAEVDGTAVSRKTTSGNAKEGSLSKPKVWAVLESSTVSFFPPTHSDQGYALVLM